MSRRRWTDNTERGVVRGEVNLLTAVRRRWFVVWVSVVVGIALAAGVALLQTPIYEAEAQLFVGTVDVPAEAVSGYVVATDSLAETYAQLASSTEVIGAAANEAGVRAPVMVAETDAEAVPESPLISVVARNEDPDRASAMADALAGQLAGYVEDSRSQESSSEELRKQLVTVSRRLEKARINRDRSQQQLDDLTANIPNASASELQAGLTRSAGNIAVLELERDALKEQLVADRLDAQSQVTLRTVSEARVIGSNASTVTWNLAAVGGGAGLLVGIAFALSLESRAARRARNRERRQQSTPRPPPADDDTLTTDLSDVTSRVRNGRLEWNRPPRNGDPSGGDPHVGGQSTRRDASGSDISRW